MRPPPTIHARLNERESEPWVDESTTREEYQRRLAIPCADDASRVHARGRVLAAGRPLDGLDVALRLGLAEQPGRTVWDRRGGSGWATGRASRTLRQGMPRSRRWMRCRRQSLPTSCTSAPRHQGVSASAHNERGWGSRSSPVARSPCRGLDTNPRSSGNPIFPQPHAPPDTPARHTLTPTPTPTSPAIHHPSPTNLPSRTTFRLPAPAISRDNRPWRWTDVQDEEEV